MIMTHLSGLLGLGLGLYFKATGCRVGLRSCINLIKTKSPSFLNNIKIINDMSPMILPAVEFVEYPLPCMALAAVYRPIVLSKDRRQK